MDTDGDDMPYLWMLVGHCDGKQPTEGVACYIHPPVICYHVSDESGQLLSPGIQ